MIITGVSPYAAFNTGDRIERSLSMALIQNALLAARSYAEPTNLRQAA